MLRIGVVHGGTVIEDRIVKPRSHVTIGPSEEATFVVPAPAVPRGFRLFELVGGDYHLNVLCGMEGRIAREEGISDLSTLRGRAEPGPHGATRIRLTELSRGKVVVGETTFLFQFGAPEGGSATVSIPITLVRAK